MLWGGGGGWGEGGRENVWAVMMRVDILPPHRFPGQGGEPACNCFNWLNRIIYISLFAGFPFPAPTAAFSPGSPFSPATSGYFSRVPYTRSHSCCFSLGFCSPLPQLFFLSKVPFPRSHGCLFSPGFPFPPPTCSCYSSLGFRFPLPQLLFLSWVPYPAPKAASSLQGSLLPLQQMLIISMVPFPLPTTS